MGRWPLLRVSRRLVALLGLAYVLFRALHAPYDSLWWPVSRSVSHAVGEAVLLAPRDTPVPYLAAALTLAGCYAVLRHNRHWWLLGCHCAFVFLWVVVSAATVPDFRNFFGAPWYNDNYRLASLLPITAIPLAALGFEFVLGKVDDAVGARLSNGRPGWLSGALVGVGVLVLLVGTQVGNKQEMIAWVNDHYTVTPDSVLVDSDEYRRAATGARDRAARWRDRRESLERFVHGLRAHRTADHLHPCAVPG